ncbi:MAG: FecR domain-containing protein, partial [Dehalococcoidia bacterium]
MAKLSISRLARLSRRTKIGLGLAVALISIALVSYWLMIGEAWTEQPVMLRILRGEVEIHAVHGGEPIGSADMTWLDAGNCITAKENSLAVLQYFEGSAVVIEGPAEVHLSWSRSRQGQLQDARRSIGLEVLRGEVAVAALRQTEPGALFELRAPNSVGVVQGTRFVVEVDERGSAAWEVSQGTVRVGAITTDSELEAVVALLPLNAGDSVAIPPLPEEWREDGAMSQKMMALASDIVRRSVEEGGSDVRVKGASLVASNPETGTAVFRMEEMVRPAATPAAAPQLAPDYKVVNDEMLARMVPGIVIARPTVVKSLFVPVLPVPEAWATPTPPLVRKSPPRYLFSIYDVEKPLGVAVDPAGQRISVTESGDRRVTRVFDREGNEIMLLAPPDTVPAERVPSYVAIDRMGTVYVSDRMRHTIDIYDVDGTYLGAFVPRDNPGVSWSPLGLAFDSSGNLYVTEV